MGGENASDAGMRAVGGLPAVIHGCAWALREGRDGEGEKE